MRSRSYKKQSTYSVMVGTILNMILSVIICYIKITINIPFNYKLNISCYLKP